MCKQALSQGEHSNTTSDRRAQAEAPATPTHIPTGLLNFRFQWEGWKPGCSKPVQHFLLPKDSHQGIQGSSRPTKTPECIQRKMVTPKAAPQHIHGSHIHGFSHPWVLPSCPIPAREGFSNFSKLFLLHVRLADSLNRFISLRIKSAFCSNPHNKALFISYYVAVYYSSGVFFGFVIISSISKPEISLIVLKSLVLDFSIPSFPLK